MNKKIQKLIKNVDVVSFDIFDTLLFRPYVRPIDLFLHIERHYNAPFFMTCRVGAEQNARQKNSTKQDITFDEIYDEIDPCFQHLKQVELDWERMVLRPNPEMKAIWDFARENGKKIVVASDMYLPTEFIADVLNKNGFGGYDRLYVSGDINQTKARGTLFDTIIRDMGVAPKKILHIGDSKKSDYKRPREHGLRAYLYPHLVKTWLKNNVRMSKFYRKQDDNLGASILVAIMAMRDQAERMGMAVAKNYWEKLGYEYGGPVIYGYTRWIEQTAQNQGIDHLMFVARDGYSLQRVFNTFNTTIKNSYVYAPRFLNLICRLDYRTDKGHVADAQQRAIIEHFAKVNEQFAELVRQNDFSATPMKKFLEQNIDILRPLAQQNFDYYANYLHNGLTDSERVGIVDTITENFSAQLLIKSALPGNIVEHGFYWHTINKKELVPSSRYSAWFKTSHKNKSPSYISHWALMEFLMTSPEFPIEGITNQGEPVYKKNVSEAEKIIRTVYPDISDGIQMFADDIKNMFDGANIYLDYETTVRWVNCFIQTPNKDDKKNMFTIKTASTPQNDIYMSLFGSKIPFLTVIKHPFKSLKSAKHAVWRTKLQTISVCIFDPIKIRVRGLKSIKVVLFPKLHSTLGVLQLSIGKLRYAICIGKELQ